MAHFPEACEQTSSDLTPVGTGMVFAGRALRLSKVMIWQLMLPFGCQKTSTGCAGRPVEQEAQLGASITETQATGGLAVGMWRGRRISTTAGWAGGGAEPWYCRFCRTQQVAWFPHSCCRILTLLTDEQSLHCPAQELQAAGNSPDKGDGNLSSTMKQSVHTFCSSWCVN